MSKYKGQLEGFPEEVVEKMLDRQVGQGNPRNVGVFEKNKTVGVRAFSWTNTPEGQYFWDEVIANRNFNLFFEKYPKQSLYPKVMMVSDSPITQFNQGYKRVVFAKKNNRYLAWFSAETIEKAENEVDTKSWLYAAEVSEEVVVSIEEIIERFGIKPQQRLKIVKTKTCK